jgi:FAD synthetase
MSVDAFDGAQIAEQVYSLAKSDDPLAPLVKEALEVIDRTLDTHGYVAGVVPTRIRFANLLPRIEHVSNSFNGGKDCASYAVSPHFDRPT